MNNARRARLQELRNWRHSREVRELFRGVEYDIAIVDEVVVMGSDIWDRVRDALGLEGHGPLRGRLVGNGGY